MARSILNGAAVSSTLVVTGTAAAVTPVIIKGAASQSVALQEWHNSAGTPLARMGLSGYLQTAGLSDIATGTGPFVDMTASGVLVTNRTTTSNVPLVVKGMASQTGDLQQWQNSAGTALARILGDGRMYLTNSVPLSLESAVARSYVSDQGINMLSLIANGGYGFTPLTTGKPSVRLSLIPEYGVALHLNYDDNAAIGARDVLYSVFDGVGLHIQPYLPSHLGLRVRGQASQTADLQQWQNSAGTVLSAVDDDGTLLVAGASRVVVGVNTPQIAVIQTAADQVPVTVRAAASQTADLQQWQNSAGAVLSRVDDDGTLLLLGATRVVAGLNTNQIAVIQTAAAQVPVTVRGAASQTANIQEWQNSAGGALAKIRNDGMFLGPFLGFITDTGPYIELSANGTTVWNRTSAANVPFRITAMASQTGDLQRWQNSSSNPLLAVNASGTLLFGTAQDTNLYRSAADTLKTDDQLLVGNGLNVIGNSVLINGGGVGGSYLLLFSAGEANYRLRIRNDGRAEWGDGAGAFDTNLYRFSANVLKTDDVFQSATDMSAGGYIFAVAGAAQQVALKSVAGAAGIEFGSAGDTNLYRSAANQLKTDDQFIAGGRVGVTDGTDAFDLAVSGGIAYLQAGPVGSSGAIPIAISGMYGNTEYLALHSDRIRVSGARLTFGAAEDTNLYRVGANILKTDGALFCGGVLNVQGDIIYFNGNQDTNLYRSAANVLKSDDAFEATQVMATNNTTGTRLVSASGVGYLQAGPVGGGAADLFIGAMFAGTEYAYLNGSKLRVTSGAIWFGAAEDTNLYRSAANTLKTDDEFVVAGNRMYILGNSYPGWIFRNASNADRAAIIASHSNGELYVDYGLGGDASAVVYFRSGASYTVRFMIGNDGTIYPGPTPGDVNLYRSAANTLKTDDSFVVNGKIFLDATGYVFSSPTNATDGAFVARAAADTHNRYMVRANGFTEWGSGSAVADTNLYRAAAGYVATDGIFQSRRAAITDVAFSAYFNGASFDGWRARVDGVLEWSSGSGAQDTNLYRAGADHLKTDDQFTVGSTLYLGNADTNLYRSAANTLKTDDTLVVASGATLNSDVTGTISWPDGAFMAPRDSNGDSRFYFRVGNSGGYGTVYIFRNKADTETIFSINYDGTLNFGNAFDTNLYRSAANVLKTDDLFDASVAGLRTKHEAGSTPTGGTSGEVRVGTDKLWFQDAGTWRSLPAPAYPTMIKFGSDS